MVLGATGDRPERLPGKYDRFSRGRSNLRERIRAVLIQLGVTRGVSGGALGVDQDFMWMCADLGIPFDVMIPFEGFDLLWNAGDQICYRKLCAQATSLTTCSPGPYANWKYAVRNQAVIDASETLLAVWDSGSRGSTAATIRATQAFKPIWWLDPAETAGLGDWLM